MDATRTSPSHVYCVLSVKLKVEMSVKCSRNLLRGPKHNRTATKWCHDWPRGRGWMIQFDNLTLDFERRSVTTTTSCCSGIVERTRVPSHRERISKQHESQISNATANSNANANAKAIAIAIAIANVKAKAKMMMQPMPSSCSTRFVAKRDPNSKLDDVISRKRTTNERTNTEEVCFINPTNTVMCAW